MNTKLPIGVYEPKATNDKAYFHVDDHNLTVTYTSNQGKGDSIGRTMRTFLTYNDPKLIEGIENCWQYRPEFKGKMVGVRHPEFVETSHDEWWKLGDRMSRDHYIHTLVALKTWENRNLYRSNKLDEIVKETPFGIRNMARWTLGLILWAKALRGSKVALWFYLMIEIFMVNVIYIPVEKLCNKIAGWPEEMDQDEWELIQDDPTQTNEQYQPKINRILDGIAYPAFALQFSAYQLYVTPNTFPRLKRTLQKSLLKMVGKTNYVQRMLLGDKDIPRDKVEQFKTMSGGRWSGYLSVRNDRNMKVFPEGRYTVNLMDVDLVRHLYNETQID